MLRFLPAEDLGLPFTIHMDHKVKDPMTPSPGLSTLTKTQVLTMRGRDIDLVTDGHPSVFWLEFSKVFVLGTMETWT